jgi:hypothetical protein
MPYSHNYSCGHHLSQAYLIGLEMREKQGTTTEKECEIVE